MSTQALPRNPVARTATTAPPDDRTIFGTLAIANALICLVAFVALMVAFEFPDILSEPASTVLPFFSEHQTVAVVSYYVLAATGIAFAALAVGLGRLAGLGSSVITMLGISAGLAQTVGFIRWPLTVPTLADAWADPAANETTRAAVSASYDTLNAFAGASIGEHLGWMLQAGWGIGIAGALLGAGLVSARSARTGLGLAAGFGALTLGVVVLPFGESLEAVQGPVYSLWVLWTGWVGVTLLRSRSAKELA